MDSLHDHCASSVITSRDSKPGDGVLMSFEHAPGNRSLEGSYAARKWPICSRAEV